MTEFNVTLAHKQGSKDLNLSKGVFIQPKLDGVRCYTRLVDGEVKMFSRNHKEFKNVRHITTILEPVFAEYGDTLVLDGELYNHKFRDNFNKIISLVRKQKPTQADRFEAASNLEYHIYDMFSSRAPELLFSERNRWIEQMFRQFPIRRFCKTVETIEVDSESKVELFHSINKAEGYEGSMLRANTTYEQRRSHGLQKVKDWHDTEFQIRGFVEGKGKFAGGLGKFIGFDLDSGLEVEVPWPNITIEKRKEVWNNQYKYYGKVATFEYFEKTPAGNYRFPRFKGLRDYE